MNETGLATCVWVRLFQVGRDAVNRRNIDDLGEVAILCCSSAQLWCERLGEKERCLQIEVDCLVPSALWKLVKLSPMLMNYKHTPSLLNILTGDLLTNTQQ